MSKELKAFDSFTTPTPLKINDGRELKNGYIVLPDDKHLDYDDPIYDRVNDFIELTYVGYAQVDINGIIHLTTDPKHAVPVIGFDNLHLDPYTEPIAELAAQAAKLLKESYSA